ncbi:hypothetical protein NX801_24605 [Streptomyces sp. LP05-1]|uniref:Heparin binding hemagglutinin HbhA n=1 Tax=Streptomyces pyxinae TaxID=2970734 RepID=A0ABT2CQG1_9ACTN|nr:hypothetical protein [Streptomyces sp. LP05-1]MCS0638779.1 hypothetical protein [Streptomyces sp. LP05-1]
MAIIDELRTPLYFAAGTADLAVQQARKVPGLIERVAAEAPARFDAVRKTDPKAVQERVTDQAKEAQARVTAALGTLDTDLKKLGETAQGLALRGVGVAAEYAVRAREAYERVAEHGEQTVRTWRGEAAEEINEIAVAVEPDPEPDAGRVVHAERTAGAEQAAGAGEPVVTGEPGVAEPKARKTPAARKPAAKKPVTPTES